MSRGHGEYAGFLCLYGRWCCVCIAYRSTKEEKKMVGRRRKCIEEVKTKTRKPLTSKEESKAFPVRPFYPGNPDLASDHLVRFHAAYYRRGFVRACGFMKSVFLCNCFFCIFSFLFLYSLFLTVFGSIFCVVVVNKTRSLFVPRSD